MSGGMANSFTPFEKKKGRKKRMEEEAVKGERRIMKKKKKKERKRRRRRTKALLLSLRKRLTGEKNMEFHFLMEVVIVKERRVL